LFAEITGSYTHSHPSHHIPHWAHPLLSHPFSIGKTPCPQGGRWDMLLKTQRAIPEWSPQGTCPSITRELVSLRVSLGFQHPK